MCAATYTRSGGTLTVSTLHAIPAIHLTYEPVTAAGSVVTQDVELPEDARVEQVAFTVSAQPSGFTDIGSVATVRGANPLSGAAAACLDFGALVTVGGIEARESLSGLGIGACHRWTGSSWFPLGSGGSFAEVGTDRLLVETGTDVSGDEFAARLLAEAGVHLPAAPTSLELSVDGVTVWFERQGSAAGTAPERPDNGVAYRIDRTDLVRQAFDRATVAGGVKSVRVTLRAATPGSLLLQPEISSLRVHTVQFPPPGLASTEALAEEGPVTFDISPPASATEVVEVTLAVRGAFGQERVQPPSGPPVEPDAALAVVAGRPVLLGIPAALAESFGERGRLGGIRLRLRTPRAAEVAGRLLADAGGRPGDPVPGADVTALQLPAGVDAWHTLAFPEPVDMPVPPETQDVVAWLELQVSYGEVECALTLSGGAPLLRRLPGGGTDELTTVPAIGVLRGALRVVGTPDRDHPIPAVTLSVPGGNTEVGVTPTGDDLVAVLSLAEPVNPGTGVALVALAAAPGSLTVDTVRVAYREGAPS